MRSFIISVLSLSIVLLCWFIFSGYTDNTLRPVTEQCDTVVMTAVEDQRWGDAYSSFHRQYTQWHKYKKAAYYFLDTEAVNQTDSLFAKTLMYIKAKDLSNSSGELLALQEQLKFLLQSEKPSLENIL